MDSAKGKCIGNHRGPFIFLLKKNVFVHHLWQLRHVFFAGVGFSHLSASLAVLHSVCHASQLNQIISNPHGWWRKAAVVHGKLIILCEYL